MIREAKYSFETKYVIMKYINGESSANYEAILLATGSSRILEWISLYQSLRVDGLITTNKNISYSKKLKSKTVTNFLSWKIIYFTQTLLHSLVLITVDNPSIHY